MIEAQSLTKRYGSQLVLDAASFAVPSGAVAAVVGKNGSGKSTLLSILAGMLTPDAGAVRFAGRDPSADPQLRREIGYVAQGDCLFEELSVRDNLRFWASAAGLSRDALSKNRFVELLGVGEFLSKRVSRLSGGMRRRVAICASLLGDPAYLLLDEPFTGLDLMYKRELCDSLRSLGEMGKTLLYTTHSAEEVEALSGTVLLLADGRIVLQTSTRDLQTSGISIQQTLINLLKGDNHYEQ